MKFHFSGLTLGFILSCTDTEIFVGIRWQCHLASCHPKSSLTKVLGVSEV